jgi:hypothetical protein
VNRDYDKEGALKRLEEAKTDYFVNASLLLRLLCEKRPHESGNWQMRYETQTQGFTFSRSAQELSYVFIPLDDLMSIRGIILIAVVIWGYCVPDHDTDEGHKEPLCAKRS